MSLSVFTEFVRNLEGERERESERERSTMTDFGCVFCWHQLYQDIVSACVRVLPFAKPNFFIEQVAYFPTLTNVN